MSTHLGDRLPGPPSGALSRRARRAPGRRDPCAGGPGAAFIASTMRWMSGCSRTRRGRLRRRDLRPAPTAAPSAARADARLRARSADPVQPRADRRPRAPRAARARPSAAARPPPRRAAPAQHAGLARAAGDLGRRAGVGGERVLDSATAPSSPCPARTSPTAGCSASGASASAQRALELAAARDQVLGLVDVEHGQRGGAAGRVAGVGRAVAQHRAAGLAEERRRDRAARRPRRRAAGSRSSRPWRT